MCLWILLADSFWYFVCSRNSFGQKSYREPAEERKDKGCLTLATVAVPRFGRCQIAGCSVALSSLGSSSESQMLQATSKQQLLEWEATNALQQPMVFDVVNQVRVASGFASLGPSCRRMSRCCHFVLCLLGTMNLLDILLVILDIFSEVVSESWTNPPFEFLVPGDLRQMQWHWNGLDK